MRLEELFRNVGSVTMKLTMGCNLKCVYCNTETVTPNTPKMSIDLWKRVTDLVMENSSQRYISLEFHGGEPLLLDDEFFTEATRYTHAKAKEHGKFAMTPMVTNGTMLDGDRLERLRKLGIRFSLSCDGPPEINDQVRAAGHAVERALRLFREHGVSLGVMTVISKSNAGRMREVMDFFRGLGYPDFRTNWVQPQGRGTHEYLLTPEEMLEASVTIIDHMVETDVSVYDAETGQFIERFVQGRDEYPRLACWEYNCQAGKTYVAIDLHGNINPCGSDMFTHTLGRLQDGEIDDELYRERMAALHHKDSWYLRCFDCPAKRICNHSCATSDYNSQEYRERECLFTKMLWNHLCEHPEKASHVYNIASQRGWTRPPQSFVAVSELAYSATSVV